MLPQKANIESGVFTGDNLGNIQVDEIDRWIYRFDIPADTLNGIDIHTGYVPATGSLKHQGYYHCHVFVEIAEDPGIGVGANMLEPHTLAVQGANDTIILIDKTGSNQLVTPLNTDLLAWYSLQGSLMVRVTDANPVNWRVMYQVTMPNGTVKQITGGYMHLEYIGATLGELPS